MASLFRRIAPAVLVTGAAVAVVSLFDPALAGGGTPTPDGGGLSPVPRPSSTPSAHSGGGGTSGSKADAGSTAGTSANPAPTPSTSDAPATSGGCDAAQEVDGPMVRTRFGPVQVAANVTADGQVCQVYAIAYPTQDRRSAQISDYAIPRLDASATKAGINFQWISGATYTSDGYATSLQALLDSL